MQCKWVYRTKMDFDGLDMKYKARFVSKFFSQFHEVDYTETFALLEKMDSIRLVLAIVASKQWEVRHMDVKSDFIHGKIHEYIYMGHPEGFIQDPSLLCKFNKYLCGL